SASLVDQLFLNENDIERFQSLFHHSARFNELDLLSIGEDHVFIIHRQLLLQDIHDYLTGSPKGLQRVFVNVDHHLSQPEIMPCNRYRALEDYVRDVLLPEIERRIKSWDQAEQSYQPLIVPNKLSLVTLTGWLLSYPVNYVLPGLGRRYSSGAGRRVGTADSDSDSEEFNDDGAEDEDEDQDNGRNALANQVLVVTRVNLQPNPEVEGLSHHCLLSFSYPSELAERFVDRSSPTPPSPLSPEVEKDEYQFESSSESLPTPSPSSSSFSMSSATSTTTTAATTASSTSVEEKEGEGSNAQEENEDEPSSSSSSCSSSMPLSRSLCSDTFDHNRPLPFRNPDIYAAGRSFLTQLHNRFQKQNIWKSWEVGQQSVVLPVVAM
ncbi:hypothetical protein BX616_004887, partial [Lobosporangium transversale]